MEENNILLKDYIKSNFTKEQIEKDLITLYDDKKHPNLLFKPMEPLKNFCRDNKEWAEWEVIKELNIKSWKDTSIHEISIKPSKTLINMTKSYLTVEQYCIKKFYKR